jgi:hypothetical protein
VDGQLVPGALLRLGDERAQQARADPPPSEGRQQRDVHDPDVARAPVHVEPARPLPLHLDDVECGAGIVAAVVGVLRGVLVLDERAQHGVVPRQMRELGRAHAGVQLDQERPVVVGHRAQVGVRH